MEHREVIIEDNTQETAIKLKYIKKTILSLKLNVLSKFCLKYSL